jgi:threonine dehydrogenase-like Zn-dependent dehydrogenase
MGILCAWVLQQAGAIVAVSQRSVERRRLASDLGADAVLGPDDDPADVLGGNPRLAIVTAAGAEALEWALTKVAVGGVVHAFAGSPDGAPVDANVVHYRHLTLRGSTGSSLADYVRARELAATRAIDLARLPRIHVALEDAPGALVTEPDPSALKVLVDVKER